ncbi:hypothetical protein BLNAU_1018 [Blattamonas nauphoetae]|uniref:Uncharacterized protein n=1 Tax=Blattamonas nauphoetae TaxID=2049346 RepID=A0ABQ9YJK4_9EUKA|nr:hypothetical protein BLNAU_1018 [Blattamonas nauphoetae]
MTTSDTTMDSSLENSCSDCSPFLNWSEEQPRSVSEKAVVFRSLVATVQSQPALDISLEVKAVKVLESVVPNDVESTDAFLNSLASNSYDPVSDFVQLIVVLVSSASLVIPTAAIKMLSKVIDWFSATVRLSLIKADLMPRLIIILKPQSLYPTETEDIHTGLLDILSNSLYLLISDGLQQLGIKEDDDHQAVHEMPTMDFILSLPIVLTIPSCLAFYDHERSIWFSLTFMVVFLRKWNKKDEEERQMWKAVHRMLRMEGIEDVIDQRLKNDKNSSFGGWIVDNSIQWNNLQGMNLPQRG